MINKPNLSFPTLEKFLAKKISADKNNTTYRQYSLEREPVEGEPDVMWQSVVYILEEQMIWTNGKLMQRTIYIDKPVTDTSAFIAIQSAFEGRYDVQAINGECISTYTMQYDDTKFGYAWIKRVYSFSPLAQIENQTDKSFDVHIKGATEDFNLILNIVVEHDGFECQIIKVIEVKYIRTIMPLIFRNTSDQVATFKAKMTGVGSFYWAMVDNYGGDEYDYDYDSVEYEATAFDDKTKTISLEPGQSYFIYSIPEYYTPSSSTYLNFIIDAFDIEVTGDVLALCNGKMVAYACYHMFSSSSALTRMPRLKHYATLSNYCFSYMFSLCSNLNDICDIEADTFGNSCCESMFFGCSSLVDLSGRKVYASTRFSGSSCCWMMFYNCEALETAPQLPTMVLSANCYQDMFKLCVSLINPPELPAEIMAQYCYYYMFYQCYSLKNAPKLKSKSLAQYCYSYMFIECTALETAPELPATSLATHCYDFMFIKCSALVNAPVLPAETLSTYCYYGMFNNCTSLVNAPELPAKTLVSNCYRSMFSGCTSLVNAPVLPAKTLVSNCYYFMFNGCSSLNYIKAMFTTAPSTSYTSSWVKDVSATGTFVKNSAATWTTTGVNAVPTGWSVEYADE